MRRILPRACWSGMPRAGIGCRVMVPAGDIQRYHTAAVELADEARRIITPALERGFVVKTKADSSLVTEVDQAIERGVRELIGRWFPNHGVIGEEYPPTRPDSDAGIGLGAFRNPQRIRLAAAPVSQESEHVRLALSARIN